jgi:Skp family chaperone for outer membrane proteins
MIMKKESIILGHSSKDITSEILKIINNEKIKIEIK